MIRVFLLAILIISCNTTKSKFIAGEYASTKKSKLYNYFYRPIYFVNSRLTLKVDSTYLYSTCGNKSSGYWYINNDSLILFCKENKYRIDSLNKPGVILKTNFASKFRIRGNYLIQSEVVIRNGKRRLLYNLFKLI